MHRTPYNRGLPEIYDPKISDDLRTQVFARRDWAGITGGSDKVGFRFFYSGTLQVGDDAKIPIDVKRYGFQVTILEVYLKVAPTGQDAKFTFYDNGVAIDTVTVTAGTTYGFKAVSHYVPANSPVTMTIPQVGNVIYGVTASGFARAA